MFLAERRTRPSLRWRGDEKQRFLADRRRAVARGHAVSRTFIEYGDPANPNRWSHRCTCGERRRFLFEAEAILAERAHVRLHGSGR